jgi:hypothetical protein
MRSIMKRAVIVLSLFVAFDLFTVVLRAQNSPSPSPSSTPKLEVPPAAANADDPGAATKAWLDTVPGDRRARSDAYFEGGYWILLWNFLLSAAISIFLLQSRVSARLRDFAEQITRFKWLQVWFYAVPFVLISAILSFPLAITDCANCRSHLFADCFGRSLLGLSYRSKKLVAVGHSRNCRFWNARQLFLSSLYRTTL